MKKLIALAFLLAPTTISAGGRIQSSGGGSGGSGSGDIEGVTAGPGLSGGGTSGTVTLSLDPNATHYIHNQNTLQDGATFYVSSGSVLGQLSNYGDVLLGPPNASSSSHAFRYVSGNITSVGHLGDTIYLSGSGIEFVNNDISVGSFTNGTLFQVIPAVQLAALDCTGNANGGAITADTDGNLSCTDDDSGGGGGASALAVGTGTATSYMNNASTPVAIINLERSQFNVLDTDTTAYVNLAAGGITATELAADSVSASELNATGVEAELEAVLDLDELQGQIGDGQIAAGAVDGGSGGEIADGSITAHDVDTSSFTMVGPTITLGTETDGIYVASLTVTSPITLSGSNNVESAAPIIGLTQNAGTDITADLEEESHASEHQDGGADEISVTGLSGILNDPQKVAVSTGTTQMAVSTLTAFVAGANMTITAEQNTSSTTIRFVAAGGSGSPGGSDTQFQYNNGGSFGGTDSFVYHSSSNSVTISSHVKVTNVSTMTWQDVSSMSFGNGTLLTLSSSAILQVPASSVPPSADCDADSERGRIYVDTNATTGQQFYGCEGTGGWVLQGDGGGGGGDSGSVNGTALTDFNLSTAVAKTAGRELAEFIVDTGASPDAVSVQTSSNTPIVLFRQQSLVTVANSTAETEVFSATVPANAMGNSRMLRLTILADQINNSGGAETARVIAIRIGGTLRYQDTMIALAASASRYGTELVAHIGMQNATNTMFLSGIYRVGTAGGATVGIGNAAVDETIIDTPFASSGTFTQDSTAAFTVTVTIDHGTANANIDWRNQYAILELL